MCLFVNVEGIPRFIFLHTVLFLKSATPFNFNCMISSILVLYFYEALVILITQQNTVSVMRWCYYWCGVMVHRASLSNQWSACTISY